MIQDELLLAFLSGANHRELFTIRIYGMLSIANTDTIHEYYSTHTKLTQVTLFNLYVNLFDRMIWIHCFSYSFNSNSGKYRYMKIVNSDSYHVRFEVLSF